MWINQQNMFVKLFNDEFEKDIQTTISYKLLMQASTD